MKKAIIQTMPIAAPLAERNLPRLASMKRFWPMFVTSVAGNRYEWRKSIAQHAQGQ